MRVTTDSQRYLTEKQAADYLGFRPATLRQSRWSGLLAGSPAPCHLTFGRSVRYQQADLEAWAMGLAARASK